MRTSSGRNLVALLLGIVLSLGCVVWISGGRAKAKSVSAVATQAVTPIDSQTATSGNDSTAMSSSNYEESYGSGYRDGWREATESRVSATSSRVRLSRSSSNASPRRSVAGASYRSAPRRGHSTRNTILTIAAPAALGAGVGAIAAGKKGAGAGALLGGGAGALYHLLRNRR